MVETFDQHYAVVRLGPGIVAYLGNNLFQAAVALQPGTCHGQGPTAELAKQDAIKWAEFFRERKQGNH